MIPSAIPAPARLSRATAIAALPLLAGLACSEGPTEPEPAEPITELPRSLSSVEREVLAASNVFAFDLAGELLPTEPDENLFFSPLSASMLLGMILNGADGNTFGQMREVLGFAGLSQEEINQGYADLADLLLHLDPAVTVEIGNSVWADQGFPVLPDFYERVRTSFDAEARTVDLGAPATLQAINGWASEATNGRIEKIFDELPANAVMVLLNAIYFKASWTTEFDESRTQPAPFTRPDGSQVTVDMMRLEAELPVGWRDGALVVDLPYGGQAFRMTVVVPAPGVPVNDLVRNLTGEAWEAWTEELSQGKAIVHLPRFELDWEARLNETLQALGMRDAFDAGAADFTRLTPGGGVWLDLVKQKAFVKVDEEGTEAAAVSGGIVVESAPMEVRADRPFLFVLRERLTGAVLFVGVVNDPTA
jgi:serine protease inhibitor